MEERVGELLKTTHYFYDRGWSPGTSGNFSVVLEERPLRLAITPSGVPKGLLSLEQIVRIDADGKKLGSGSEIPSSESPAHLTIVKAAGAGAVIHTHSTSATVVSDLYAKAGGFFFQGYEMLKGLRGVKSPEHREWIPILENLQDMQALSKEIKHTLAAHPEIHGFLLKRHGLYTWGENLEEAGRHAEVLEFLLEAKLKRKAGDGSKRGAGDSPRRTLKMEPKGGHSHGRG